MTNCTIFENGAGSGWALYCGGPLYIPPKPSYITLSNCILWNPGGEIVIDDGTSAVTAAFSDIEGGWPGNGNVNVNPVCGESGRLLPGSPCIDAGHNWAVPQDTMDLDDDGNIRELIPFDLDGNPRFSADENDLNPGCGTPVVVDIGAYEHQFAPVEEVLFADTDADLDVDADDLVQLVLDFGPCVEECCINDYDLDGDVDVDDLLALILGWG
jgi:hypothetical protein